MFCCSSSYTIRSLNTKRTLTYPRQIEKRTLHDRKGVPLPTRALQESGSCGPAKLTEKGKFPKVLRGGCKRSFGPREQRSPKSLLRHPNLILHRCKSSFGWCKRLFGDLCSLGPKDLLHPPLSTFGNFPFSVNFPGLQLPNPRGSSEDDTCLALYCCGWGH